MHGSAATKGSNFTATSGTSSSRTLTSANTAKSGVGKTHLGPRIEALAIQSDSVFTIAIATHVDQPWNPWVPRAPPSPSFRGHLI
mmetsp:Transcript_90839/g.157572  ORF Transcript_90839/g.157572 Transcript_90839/m.157572 type:complete len:85 (-) Transcript_90839:1586-1840(-)